MRFRNANLWCRVAVRLCWGLGFGVAAGETVGISRNWRDNRNDTGRVTVRA